MRRNLSPTVSFANSTKQSTLSDTVPPNQAVLLAVVQLQPRVVQQLLLTSAHTHVYRVDLSKRNIMKMSSTSKNRFYPQDLLWAGSTAPQCPNRERNVTPRMRRPVQV